MSIVIIAEIEPSPRDAATVREALLTAVTRVRSEDDGCERYELHRDPRTGGFVMVERWRDQAALDAHAAGPAFAALSAALEGRLAVPIALRPLETVEV
jgi:quinol monooxygenase YgiN